MNIDQRIFIYDPQFVSSRQQVPDDVTHVIIDSSVTEIARIPDGIFDCLVFPLENNLVNVQLNEGLKVIGRMVFYLCKSLRNINFPSTLTEIGHSAFGHCESLVRVDLPKGIKIIGSFAFDGCYSLKRFIVPSTVKTIEEGTFYGCFSLESIELNEGLQNIGDGAFHGCSLLKNSYILTGAGSTIFMEFTYDTIAPPSRLCRLFPNDLRRLDRNDDRNFSLLMTALTNRFDGLPIHKLCYFQAHHLTATTLENLCQAIESDGNTVERGDPFGMTPFHILALSDKPNIELFQALLEQCPTSLLSMKDAWGNRSIDYLFNCDMPDSNALIKYLIQVMIVDRLKFLGLEEWRRAVVIEVGNFEHLETLDDKKRQLKLIYSFLARYERLEATSLLEELLWKMKIDKALSTSTDTREETNGKISKIDHSESLDRDHGLNRQSCRVICGADIVISNVLSFLGKVDFDDNSNDDDEEEESYYSNDDDDDEDSYNTYRSY